MKTELEELLAQALERLQGSALHAPVERSLIAVERARDAQHGDYASNIAMRLGKAAGRQAARPGCCNRRRTSAERTAGARRSGRRRLHQFPPGQRLRSTTRCDACSLKANATARATQARGQRVIVEFVSANPTGPLHVGHGRQAAYGATLSNLLRAAGHRVHREYYINDAGRQVDILTASVWVRYLQALGEAVPFPENGYRADYVNAIGAALRTSTRTRCAIRPPRCSPGSRPMRPPATRNSISMR